METELLHRNKFQNLKFPAVFFFPKLYIRCCAPMNYYLNMNSFTFKLMLYKIVAQCKSHEKAHIIIFSV